MHEEIEIYSLPRFRPAAMRQPDYSDSWNRLIDALTRADRLLDDASASVYKVKGSERRRDA